MTFDCIGLHSYFQKLFLQLIEVIIPNFTNDNIFLIFQYCGRYTAGTFNSHSDSPIKYSLLIIKKNMKEK